MTHLSYCLLALTANPFSACVLRVSILVFKDQNDKNIQNQIYGKNITAFFLYKFSFFNSTILVDQE